MMPSFNPQQNEKETKEYYPIINKGYRHITDDFSNKERSFSYERKPLTSFVNEYIPQDTRAVSNTL